jgi:hypothetical protein
VKLAIAFVAALSLVGCADEPNDPAAGLYGAGIGKVILTDPLDIKIEPVQTRQENDLDEGWIGEVEIHGTCANCNYAAHHYMRDGVEIVDIIDTDGVAVCNYWDGHNHGDCFNQK